MDVCANASKDVFSFMVFMLMEPLSPPPPFPPSHRECKWWVQHISESICSHQLLLQDTAFT